MSDPPEAFDPSIEELLNRVVKELEARGLRRARPWAYDITRVLADRPRGVTLQRIYESVRGLRDPVDLPKPKEFEATVCSTI